MTRAHQDSAGSDAKLVDNIVHFCRALRKAGIAVGTSQVQSAVQAVGAVGFSSKVDFYYTLRATLISREEHLTVYHQVFSLFWRDPEFLQKMMYQLSPTLRDKQHESPPVAAQRRATDALQGKQKKKPVPKREEVVRDALLTVSDQQVLRHKDFEQMTTAELREAENAIRQLRFHAPSPASRRFVSDHMGRFPDARNTLKSALRRHGELLRIERRSVKPRLPNLVVICDISGSMAVYSRMFMRFLHALMHARVREWNRVETFTFGTRLTNISRSLRHRDVDTALSTVGREASDWEGGTLIGITIKQFNKEWARRVLTRNAILLFISDGLERGDTDLLSAEMSRLSLFCRHLIWLNPLLRWDGFSPQASGIKAILPHVDSFHACHSLESLADLSNALISGLPTTEKKPPTAPTH
ncbi:MAG: VWA domain-containing protein [Pseudomonadota bacterium]